MGAFASLKTTESLLRGADKLESICTSFESLLPDQHEIAGGVFRALGESTVASEFENLSERVDPIVPSTPAVQSITQELEAISGRFEALRPDHCEAISLFEELEETSKVPAFSNVVDNLSHASTLERIAEELEAITESFRSLLQTSLGNAHPLSAAQASQATSFATLVERLNRTSPRLEGITEARRATTPSLRAECPVRLAQRLLASLRSSAGSPDERQRYKLLLAALRQLREAACDALRAALDVTRWRRRLTDSDLSTSLRAWLDTPDRVERHHQSWDRPTDAERGPPIERSSCSRGLARASSCGSPPKPPTVASTRTLPAALARQRACDHARKLRRVRCSRYSSVETYLAPMPPSPTRS